MNWERIVSRDNKLVRAIGKLAVSAKYRRECGEYICEGLKPFLEALRDGVEIHAVIWEEMDYQRQIRVYPQLQQRLDALSCRKALVPDALYAHISILEHSAGPLFLCACPPEPAFARGRYLALDGLQDPGNLGTILRTAEAFGMDGVILMEGCADAFQPKTVRAAMGSLFRQKLYRMDADALFAQARTQGLPVYAAALYGEPEDLDEVVLQDALVIIGSEGHGVREENLRRCTGSLRIPMCGQTESLNAAVAASIIMWEMRKWRTGIGSGLQT